MVKNNENEIHIGRKLVKFLSDTAAIRGTVLDQSRAAVAGAEIAVTNNRTGMRRVMQTDGSGNFANRRTP